MCRTRALCRVAILAFGLAVSIAGCYRSFQFTIEGVVRDASDGAALEGVHVSLERTDLSPLAAQADEAFIIRFSVGQSEIKPPWVLVLAKDGYDTERIDISPGLTTATVSERIYVVAYLRRATSDDKTRTLPPFQGSFVDLIRFPGANAPG